MEALSVFRGGFTLEAAAAVIGTNLPTLAALTDKSLLHSHFTDHGQTAVRYEMHERLRQYTAVKLRESEAYETIHDRHEDTYCRLLGENVRHLRGADLRQAIQAVTDDIENIRNAWRWAVKNGQISSLALAIEGLLLYHEVRSWFREGEELFGLATAMFTARVDKLNVIERLIYGLTLTAQGWFAHRQARYEEAETLLHTSLQQLGAHQEKAFYTQRFSPGLQ